MTKFPRIFKTVFNFSSLLFIFAVMFLSIRAAGEIDTNFDAAVQNIIAGSVETIILQPDGKLLVGGNFTVANNSARTNIARFNADGTVDQTFNPPDFYKNTTVSTYALNESFIYAIAVQADGKVVVGGNFNRIGINLTQRGLVRLNADGSVDNSFVIPPLYAFSAAIVYDIKIQSDNRIVVAGNIYFRDPNGDRQYFARLNTNGSIDASFNPFSFGGGFSTSQIRNFAIQPDGKIIYRSGDGNIRRINSDSSPDNSFAPAAINNAVNRIVVQSDGKVLVGGLFSTVNGFTQNSITRLNADGTLDTSFNTNGTGTGQEIKGIAVLPDGKIAIVGLFTTYNSVQKTKNARLNANGTLDTTFNYNPGTTAIINDVKSLGDGRIIIGGVNLNGNMSKLSRISADGSLDASFVGRIYTKGSVSAVYAQPDGKILVGGEFTSINGVARINFARLNQDGSVDSGFVADAVNPNSASGRVTSIGLQSDGKIIIAGGFRMINGIQKIAMARLNTDGSLDTSFVAAAGGSKLIVLPDDKILVPGFRLNSDGSIDSSFNQTSVNSAIFTLKVQADGKIVIGGGFTQVNGTPRGRIARLNADGTLDTTFNPPFGANGGVNDLVIQSDGKIVIGGTFTGVNGVDNRRFLARLNTDGGLDTSFNPTLDGFVNVIAKQSDGKILIGGEFGLIYGVAPYDLARINQNGSFDSTFAGPGANDYVRSIFVQSDNKILVGGDFSRVNNISRVGVARLLNNAATARTQFDYDGDGRADLTVFRPSNGAWYVLPSQSNSFYGVQFGQAGDKIAPADYDGDGKTDIAVFRENISGGGSTGAFFILNSSNNTFRPVAFGSTGDVPISGDWDGDGTADLALYRDGSLTGGASLFLYRPSSQPTVDYRAISWGAAGDKPVTGDFDGDGKLDAAIFRPSLAQWYILRSSNSQFFAVQFGAATDIIVAADYNGDGITDVGVFRPSTGTWYYSSSQTNPSVNFTGIQFGTSSDLPVPADYDGDGKADVAVFRPSTGAWFLQRSTQGFTGVQFGANGDKPAPNAYVR